jgi:hypothetical protein
MSRIVPTNGRARMIVFLPSPSDEKRKIDPRSPAMSVMPKR